MTWTRFKKKGEEVQLISYSWCYHIKNMLSRELDGWHVYYHHLESWSMEMLQYFGVISRLREEQTEHCCCKMLCLGHGNTPTMETDALRSVNGSQKMVFKVKVCQTMWPCGPGKSFIFLLTLWQEISKGDNPQVCEWASSNPGRP